MLGVAARAGVDPPEYDPRESRSSLVFGCDSARFFVVDAKGTVL